MSFRLRYELHLERFFLRREYPKRRLRLIRPGERRRLHRGDLFPNVEQLRMGADFDVDECGVNLRIRLQRELHVERKFVRCRHEKRRVYVTSGKRFLEYRFVNHADVERNGVDADRRMIPERNRQCDRVSVRLQFLTRLGRKRLFIEMGIDGSE